MLCANSGGDGIDRAIAEQPDTILLDVKLPGLDGPSTLAILQSNAATARIPVVFLTASVQAAERRQLETLGVRGVLSKPFDPLRLPSDLADALGWVE